MHCSQLNSLSYLYLRVILLCISVSLINSSINNACFHHIHACALVLPPPSPQRLCGPCRNLALCILIWFFHSVHWCSFRLFRATLWVCVHLLYVISRKHLLQWNASDFYIHFRFALCILLRVTWYCILLHITARILLLRVLWSRTKQRIRSLSRNEIARFAFSSFMSLFRCTSLCPLSYAALFSPMIRYERNSTSINNMICDS